MSRTGFFLCAMYAMAASASLLMAWSADGDLKGRFVFLQLPLSLPMSVLSELGLDHWLDGLGWTSAYLLLGLPTFACLYLMGWAVEKCVLLIEWWLVSQ
jgi:hypothetical protein